MWFVVVFTKKNVFSYLEKRIWRLGHHCAPTVLYNAVTSHIQPFIIKCSLCDLDTAPFQIVISLINRVILQPYSKVGEFFFLLYSRGRRCIPKNATLIIKSILLPFLHHHLSSNGECPEFKYYSHYWDSRCAVYITNSDYILPNSDQNHRQDYEAWDVSQRDAFCSLAYCWHVPPLHLSTL